MKYAREIKVGLLAAVCLFLLYFGFYYLKGVNIFSSTHSFHGEYVQVGGLQEQAPVFIKGFKVGQVDHILYDFTKDTAFVVDISVKKDIHLPKGSVMALVPNGLMGGTAIELILPNGNQEGEYATEEFLPTIIVPGLLDNLQDSVTGSIAAVIRHADSLLLIVQSQIGGNHIENTLINIDNISSDLTSVSHDLRGLMNTRVPGIVEKVDSTMDNLSQVVSDVQQANVPVMLANMDTAVNTVKTALTTKEGTLGLLLNDQKLYTNINTTVVSVDSLVTDLKAHPKRYVHFSLFGRKDKEKKAKK